ncbi:TPA: hypothetical protein ACIJV1_001567 [Klebsiella pneumoniae]
MVEEVAMVNIVNSDGIIGYTAQHPDRMTNAPVETIRPTGSDLFNKTTCSRKI